MIDRDAQEIVRMIESNWRMDLGTARGMWREELMGYDAEMGVKAVAHLAKTHHGRPDLADLVEVLLLFRNQEKQKKAEEQAAKARKIEEEGKRGHAAPEWVWVWSWARSAREPVEERSFPQQQGWNPDAMMTMAEYEDLRDEWYAAGSPKAKNPIMLARK